MSGKIYVDVVKSPALLIVPPVEEVLEFFEGVEGVVVLANPKKRQIVLKKPRGGEEARKVLFDEDSLCHIVPITKEAEILGLKNEGEAESELKDNSLVFKFSS
ncbi:hypothetical protein [Thermococcus sp. LS2]|uniref:hypothetical protein n=1 Tax=Thermococcus sp. LS2 TaxID=1638260 RepID=UPI00143A159B|nr:hypothetical protein [Thermococcus sp. LS2]NJE11996.1 hypothetical protein [Thermococcus sp. LS2]